LLEPTELWMKKDELFAAIKQWPQVKLNKESTDTKAGRFNLDIEPLPALAAAPQTKEPMSALRQFSEGYTGKIVFSVESEGRREALLELLSPVKIAPKAVPSLEDALSG
ncbi:hypothetical protein, partial [Vibrio sp. 10N.222.49.C9]